VAAFGNWRLGPPKDLSGPIPRSCIRLCSGTRLATYFRSTRSRHSTDPQTSSTQTPSTSFTSTHSAFNMATASLHSVDSNISKMSALEREDKERDAAFNKILHGKSAQARGGIAAMRSKDKAAQEEALSEYFKVGLDRCRTDEYTLILRSTSITSQRKTKPRRQGKSGKLNTQH
jgi:hypothetical protein